MLPASLKVHFVVLIADIHIHMGTQGLDIHDPVTVVTQPYRILRMMHTSISCDKRFGDQDPNSDSVEVSYFTRKWYQLCSFYM